MQIAKSKWDTVQHTILHGEFELSLDEKNRVMIPAELRRVIDPESQGAAFFLTIGLNRKPWLYLEKTYESIVSAAENDIAPDADALAFDQMYFAMASRVEMDKQGRVLLNEKCLRRTNTNREVTLIGARNHLEIWNRADWEQQYEQNLSRMAELARKAKASRTPNAAAVQKSE